MSKDMFEDLLGPEMDTGNASGASLIRVGDAPGKTTMLTGDAYEGASIWEREVAMWQPSTRSADADMLPQKRMGDARVRDMIRNDGYSKAGVTIHQDNIVGGRYALNAKPNSRILLGKEDLKWEEEFQIEAEELFTLYAESDECWIDAGRRHTLTGLVRQVVGMYSAFGENLGTAEWSTEDNAMRAFNTSVRIIDLDRLSTPPDRTGDVYCIAGVQLNSNNVAQGYHIRQAHPSDYRRSDKVNKWTYIKARKPWGRRVAFHQYDQFRPDQTRGISDMVSGLKELRMMKDYRDAALQNAFVQATYAATIESDLPIAEIFARLGAGNLGEDMGEGVGAAMVAYMGAAQAYMGDGKQFMLGGTRIPALPAGSKLKMQPAGQSGALGTELEQSLLRYMAAILGVSYEQLSKDYSETNYSSARAAMTETWKFMQSRKVMVADRFANMVYRLWMEEALNKGLIFSGRYRKLPNFYAPMMAEAYCQCDWIGAARGQIDELKETQAAVLRAKYNFSTDEDEISRTGKDYRQVYRQRSREKKMRKLLDIEVETKDNQMNASTGAAREKDNALVYPFTGSVYPSDASNKTGNDDDAD